MTGRCSDCRYFENDPAYVEAAFPGMSSLSCAYSSVRADSGLCLRASLFVAPWKRCGDFEKNSEGTRRGIS